MALPLFGAEAAVARAPPAAMIPAVANVAELMGPEGAAAIGAMDGSGTTAGAAPPCIPASGRLDPDPDAPDEAPGAPATDAWAGPPASPPEAIAGPVSLGEEAADAAGAAVSFGEDASGFFAGAASPELAPDAFGAPAAAADAEAVWSA